MMHSYEQFSLQSEYVAELIYENNSLKIQFING